MCGVAEGGPGSGLVQWQLLLGWYVEVPLSLGVHGCHGAVERFRRKCFQCLLQSRPLGTIMDLFCG